MSEGAPGQGPVGLFGRLTFRVLGRYLREERELLAHMVRVNEALERRCDELTLRCQQLNQDMIDRQAGRGRQPGQAGPVAPPRAPPEPAARADGTTATADRQGGPGR